MSIHSSSPEAVVLEAEVRRDGKELVSLLQVLSRRMSMTDKEAPPYPMPDLKDLSLGNLLGDQLLVRRWPSETETSCCW